jgi:PAS domain S-box-containing protein
MQELHRLIKRQARKYFGDVDNVPEDLLPFLTTISQSYEHYESDRILIERAMELSSNELAQSNKKLLDESKRHHVLFKSLKESLESISAADISVEDDDILRIADVLQEEIRKRKMAEEAIKTSEEKYRGVIENMDLGLVEMDTDGKIIGAYDRFCKMMGYDHDELMGKSFIDLISDTESRDLVLRERSKRKKGEFSVYEIQMQAKQGDTVWVIISAAPVFCSEGFVCGSLAVHFDITHRKEIEAELESSRTKAEASLKSKELFLANISHEIRTPMNAIIGMSRLLSETTLKDAQQDYVKAIRTSADGLLVIINDVLDMSKIEAGKFTIEHIEFDLERLIGDLELSLAFKAEEKGIYFHCKIAPELHKHVISDPTRLNQVMVNLVSNAIKFTSSGGVTLSLDVAENREGKDLVRFSVTDTGVGIDKKKLESIFESFTQEDETISRKFGGTGLGLSICRQLVDIFGGEIDVSSVKGEGSTFSFEIELEHGNEENNTSDLPAEEQSLDGCKVLLVEDNELNRFLAITILKKWNAHVGVAENGRIALEKLAQESFDIVLMDMQMPELDGIGATMAIRNDLQMSIPIIALTANAIKGEREKCMEAGMNDYISKPFDPIELFSKIRLLLAEGAEEMEYLPMGDAPRFSLDKLKGLYRGNKHEMMQTVDLFITQIVLDIDEMCRKAECGDREGVRDLAHKIRPNIELFQISEMSKDVEYLEFSFQDAEPQEMIGLAQKVAKIAKEVSLEMKKLREN